MELSLPLDRDRETVWVTQTQIADFCGIDRTGATRHIDNVLKGAEVDRESNVQKVHIPSSERPKQYMLAGSITRRSTECATQDSSGNSRGHPQFDYPPVRVYRMSGEALTAGVEEHSIDGTPVKVFNPTKTVADSFMFRNKVGLDVALEALTEAVRNLKASRDEIMRFAEIDRVAKVIRPRRRTPCALSSPYVYS